MKKRILQLINQLGITVSEFETQCNLSNGAVQKMGDNTRRSTLDKISKRYDVDINWLLTGFGSMFRSGDKESESIKCKDNKIPLVPVEAHGGSLVGFSESVSDYQCETILSPIRDADLAMTVTGDSMAPEYPSGSRILVKRINEKAFIDWGRVYVLDTCNGAVIKKIMPGTGNESVRCVSLNPDYPEFEVRFSDIYAFFRVLLLLSEK